MGCKKPTPRSRMSESGQDDSDRDSLSSIDAFDTVETLESPDDQTRITNTRNAVREWKVREFDKTTEQTSNAKGLKMLREYVAKSARLFYDLVNFMKTSQNKEQNMKDMLYVNIVTAIGVPGALSFHVKTILESLLERDLVELPFTIEPKVVNAYAKDGLQAQQDFPEEE
jgi:hypothetical protein